MSTSTLFELEIALPDLKLSNRADRLVGFDARYAKLHQDLRLLVDPEGLAQWSKKLYQKQLPLLESLNDRYPLVVFHGDVGTGKTATAEAAANNLAKEMKREAMLFKLSTRVRGSGNVGEMSTLINQAFDVVAKEAGKSKLSFLIIDEADSLAASRANNQSHHEDKVAVNTLIQKVDDIRRFSGRVMVIFCTNHLAKIDPAILRRAAYVEEFCRPGDNERAKIFAMDCEGLGLSEQELAHLVHLSGPEGPHGRGFTFSDIRTRLIPEALGMAYPDRRITHADLVEALGKIEPSPSIVPTGGRP